jgi:hypothetical protein
MYRFLILLLILSSCSASWHLNKAKKKGAEFGTEVIYKYNTKTDTILDTLTNTVEIRTTLIDSFPYEVKTIKYVPLSRQERKRLKDSSKHVENTLRLEIRRSKDSLRFLSSKYRFDYKEAVRVAKIENRNSNWFIWIIVGFVLNIFCMFAVKRIKKQL